MRYKIIQKTPAPEGFIEKKPLYFRRIWSDFECSLYFHGFILTYLCLKRKGVFNLFFAALPPYIPMLQARGFYGGFGKGQQ
jgi:hypothetical protein